MRGPLPCYLTSRARWRTFWACALRMRWVAHTRTSTPLRARARARAHTCTRTQTRAYTTNPTVRAYTTHARAYHPCGACLAQVASKHLAVYGVVEVVCGHAGRVEVLYTLQYPRLTQPTALLPELLSGRRRAPFESRHWPPACDRLKAESRGMENTPKSVDDCARACEPQLCTPVSARPRVGSKTKQRAVRASEIVMAARLALHRLHGG